jgi:hypothetical protein
MKTGWECHSTAVDRRTKCENLRLYLRNVERVKGIEPSYCSSIFSFANSSNRLPLFPYPQGSRFAASGYVLAYRGEGRGEQNLLGLSTASYSVLSVKIRLVALWFNATSRLNTLCARKGFFLVETD